MSNHKNKTAWNDVTGDSIKTGKGSQSAYEKGYAGIDWGKNGEKVEKPENKSDEEDSK